MESGFVEELRIFQRGDTVDGMAVGDDDGFLLIDRVSDDLPGQDSSVCFEREFLTAPDVVVEFLSMREAFFRFAFPYFLFGITFRIGRVLQEFSCSIGEYGGSGYRDQFP